MAKRKPVRRAQPTAARKAGPQPASTKAVHTHTGTRKVTATKSLPTKLPGAANAALATASGLSPIKAGFTDSASGVGTRESFARQSPFLGMSYGGSAGSVYPGSRVSGEAMRDRHVVTGQVLSTPGLFSLFQANAVAVIGEGLRFSWTPDWKALGLDPESEDCERCVREVEAAFNAWAGDPIQCDLEGTRDLTDLATLALNSLAVTGEFFAQLPGQPRFGGPYLKINPVSPFLVDSTYTTKFESGNRVANGIEYTAFGAQVAFWYRDQPVGSMDGIATPKRMPLLTPFGRKNALHIKQQFFHGQTRGAPIPFAAAAVPARDREMLGEFAVAKQGLASAMAFTIETELDRDDAMGVVSPAFGSLDATITRKLAWYGAVDGSDGGTRGGTQPPNPNAQLGRMTLPGQIVHLLPGEKARVIKGAEDHNSFSEYDSTLFRNACMAAGLSYTATSDDMRRVSFSAAKLSMQLERRHTMVKRRLLSQKFYRPVAITLIEELIMLERIKLPKGCPPLWLPMTRNALFQMTFTGPGLVEADQLSANQADLLSVQSGFESYGAVLARRGQNLETVLKERAREKRLFEKAGLPLPMGAEDATRPNSNASFSDNRTTTEVVDDEV